MREAFYESPVKVGESQKQLVFLLVTRSWLLGDLTTTLGIRQVEQATAVKPLKLRDTVVEPLVFRVG